MKKINLFLLVIVFCLSWGPPTKAEMIKEACIGVMENAPNDAIVEREYLLNHGPQIASMSSAWMRKYQLWLPYEPPAEAVERFGAVRGRYAELWFTMEDYLDRPGMPEDKPLKEDPVTEEEMGNPAGYVETRPVKSVVVMVSAKPDRTFYSARSGVDNTTLIRWVTAIMYPEGVPVEEGEDWFLNVHAKEAVEQPGLLKFISYRVIDEHTKLPKGETRKWVRINEYWYADLDAWRKAVIESPPKYTVPAWGGIYPFVEMESTFIPYSPYVDFLRGGYIRPGSLY